MENRQGAGSGRGGAGPEGVENKEAGKGGHTPEGSESPNQSSPSTGERGEPREGERKECQTENEQLAPVVERQSSN